MLELVDRIRTTTGSFAEREREIFADYQERTTNATAQREKAQTECEDNLTGALDQSTAHFDALNDYYNHHHARRQAQIENAYANALQGVDSSAGDTTDREKYQVQKGMLSASRKRDSEKDSVNQARRETDANLEKDIARIEESETRARKQYRRYAKLCDRFRSVADEEIEQPDAADDEYQLRVDLDALLKQFDEDLAAFNTLELARFFRGISLPLFLVLTTAVHVGVAFVIHKAGLEAGYYQALGGFYACVVILFSFLNNVARKQTGRAVELSAICLATTRNCHRLAGERAKRRHEEDLRRIANEYETSAGGLEDQLKDVVDAAGSVQATGQEAVRDRADRIRTRCEARHDFHTDNTRREREETLAAINAEADTERERINELYDERKQRLDADFHETWQALIGEWQSAWQGIGAGIDAAREAVTTLFPDWTSDYLANWSPPGQFSLGSPFGDLAVNFAGLGELPDDEDLAVPIATDIHLPLTLDLPANGSILLETSGDVPASVAPTLNNIILRLLASAPAGRLSFTIIDPVGLGQNFAGIMHLADYEDSLINSRIWTESQQIEQRLKDLNEHMEKVIQMYLRNEYATITEYNEQAGNIAEKYHFVVVSDFPTGFSEMAAKRLLSIAASGARCGVFTLIHWDRRKRLPQDFVPDDLRKHSVCISVEDQTTIGRRPILGTDVHLQAPPSGEEVIEFIHRIGRASKDSNRIEVPFEQIAPADEEIWKTETTKELLVPIGRTGATKFQYLAIGRDTRQHALVAGKTGSGKSTLFHVAITNLALCCSPDEVEFYLIDFKKGVEFKCYAEAGLPHAKVVAIESDREFGLSVLQRVDEELKRRGDMFRKLGVQDVAGYKAAGGGEPMPRSLLLIDEFQEFFTEDDRVAQNASVMLDRIVRQGRAFGIHVMLGSQTLGGTHTLPRPTMGQMVIRIALACNEADSYIILDDTNPAARHLSRPGEGIYNDTAGSIEGNSPFQVVWLPDKVRDGYLSKIRDHAASSERRYSRPIVFEGNAPAEVRENEALESQLASQTTERTAIPVVYLGAPNSIKGPTQAVFEQQSGNNLMVVGQREDAALAILSLSLLSLGAQFPTGELRIILVDGTAPETPERTYLDNVIAAVPHEIERPRAGDLPGVFQSVADDLQQRIDGEPGELHRRTFVIIHGLQKFKKLRNEDDYGFSTDDSAPANPGTVLNNLLTEGAAYGMHVITTIDTLNNINRAISRKAQSEFEMRVLFQMSANDSASLIDSPKAGNLGLHRAIYYNEQEGHMETFRPYALPDSAWIKEVADRLKGRA
jgi:DNA segregation ATPase FtsK/SpoIIIE, S-DNA-T family